MTPTTEPEVEIDAPEPGELPQRPRRAAPRPGAPKAGRVADPSLAAGDIDVEADDGFSRRSLRQMEVSNYEIPAKFKKPGWEFHP